MNNFLAGVVRRGAGRTSPMTLRPAVGPQNIPLETIRPGPAATAASFEEPEAFSSTDFSPTLFSSTYADVTPAPPGTLRPAEPVLLPQQVRAEEHFSTAAAPPSATAPQAAAVPQAVRSAPQPNRDDQGADIQLEAKPTQTIPPVQPRAAAHQDIPATIPAHKHLGTPPALSPAAASPAQEASIKPIPTSGAERNPAVPIARGAGEQRNIQVKIGKVEIRSTQPSVPVPASRPPAKGGFDDFSLARHYLDRGQR
jgi:hypothetical protein